MPIVDVQLVVPGTEGVPPGLAQAVADALGHLFESPPGRTWVRTSTLPAANYAENGLPLVQDGLPVFVTLLLAVPTDGDTRENQAAHVIRTGRGDATSALTTRLGGWSRPGDRCGTKDRHLPHNRALSSPSRWRSLSPL